MEKGDIDKRIIEYVSYLIDNKEYKSEAEYLRLLDFPLTKLSDAKKGKAGFRAYDIGIILINDRRLNSDWVMTGKGAMFASVDSNANISYFINKCSSLEDENKKLLMEVGILKGRLQEIKKRVPEESNAICAAASGSDLEK
ncbi:hypothetical protein [Bacteroides cellulosilyticus]|jgi:hypothetical protein|uniref:hypothetical protein n=1 Tax=Bacteroides cellulosilyticus TaxID=246787 RepID=UPI001898F9A6|nr:hypothetical protein [Bacteroides cellulosilyticus]